MEIIPPIEVKHSPRAAENFFAGIWTAYGTVSTKLDKYIKGQTQEYYCLEIVGDGGDVHFYIRCQRARRNHMEAQLYAHYPGAEIVEVPDYTNNIPNVIKSPEWDIWGTVLKLAKEDAYPIRTYVDFVDIASISLSAPMIDPLSSIVETLSKLKKGEVVWIHIYARPADDDWKRGGEKLIKKIMGTEPPPKKNALLSFAGDLVGAFTDSGSGEQKAAPNVPKSFLLSEEDRATMKAIYRNISKSGYECKIQFAYMGKKDVFTKITGTAVMGLFIQFNDLNLNGLKPKKETLTRASYLLKKPRVQFKKRLLYENMKKRRFFDQTGFVLNTEELATIFHLPAVSVEAPKTPRVQAKKGSPPVDLPVG